MRMTRHRRIRRHAGTEAAPQRNEDRTRKLLATLADQSLAAAIPVAMVAVIAGIVSYGHIETLALSVHQPIGDARLLPFAVDFLIVAGSVIVLAGYWLGWLGVVAGVAGTLFANIESGLPYGGLAATVAAWPAIAFTVASFMLERWLKRQGDPVSAELQTALAAERAARESAEAEAGTVGAELKAAHADRDDVMAELASVRAELARIMAEATERKPEPTRKLAPAPRRRAEPPEVDLDAEHRILSLHTAGQLSAREAIVQLIRAGHAPSQAGPLVNKSDSYGRSIDREMKKLAVNGNGKVPR